MALSELAAVDPSATGFELKKGVGESGELLSVAVPAGVERENILLKHPLKHPDRVIAVLQN